MVFSDSNVRAETRGWKRLAKKMVVGRFYSRVDGALFVSENNRNYHAMYGVPKERLFPGVLPIDRGSLLDSVSDRQEARRSIRESLGIPESAFVVMFCGKYAAHKRPADLVAAVGRAAKKGLPVWAVLVGEGPERAAIEEHCRSENLGNAILTGFVNQATIARYYAASDALALTSAYEPFGLVVSEGASFGLPVIVSDRVGCAGPQDVARAGVNAIVYECGNVEGLQGAIESMYLDRQLYERMSDESVRISQGQDVTVAAKCLAAAAQQLREIGPR
jgi:glycosyltransferase involved in cell wall biosynthesis